MLSATLQIHGPKPQMGPQCYLAILLHVSSCFTPFLPMTISNYLLSPQSSHTQTLSSTLADAFASYLTEKIESLAEKRNCPFHPSSCHTESPVCTPISGIPSVYRPDLIHSLYYLLCWPYTPPLSAEVRPCVRFRDSHPPSRKPSLALSPKAL